MSISFLLVKNASIFVHVFAPLLLVELQKLYVIQYCCRLLDNYIMCDYYLNIILILPSFFIFFVYSVAIIPFFYQQTIFFKSFISIFNINIVVIKKIRILYFIQLK